MRHGFGNGTAARARLRGARPPLRGGLGGRASRARVADPPRARRDEAGARRACGSSLELASAVRDQYAHQAHTIIIGDASHLGFYGEARETVLRLTRALRQAADDPEERALVDEIEAESVRLDGIFRERIVPAVLARRARRASRAEHDRAQLVVTRIQDLTQRARGAVRVVDPRLPPRRRAGPAAHARVPRRRCSWRRRSSAVAVRVAIGRSIAAPVAQLQAGRGAHRGRGPRRAHRGARRARARGARRASGTR